MLQALPLSVGLEGRILTNAEGIDNLMSLFDKAKGQTNCKVEINFQNLEWIDGNLCALISAIEHRFKIERGVEFVADFQYVANKFNVLFCNGWFKSDKIPYKTDKTALPCTSFLPNEKDKFIEYIEQVFSHNGMPAIPDKVKRRIRNSMLELFTNVYRHAQSLNPLFICGQYFPRTAQLYLSIVDLGVGFLPPINSYTAGEINTDIEAIKWAIQGNSSRIRNSDDVGGIGLSSLFSYFTHTKGVFQIYSGTDFWCSDLEAELGNGHVQLNHNFTGSLINMGFNCQATVIKS